MSMSGMDEGRHGQVVIEERQKVKEPPMFKVLLHNDDYTTMDFVVMILTSVFHKSEAAATDIMLNVHKKGFGVAGIYTREIAETKVVMVLDLARQKEHPLRCTMEKL